tara:strand:+ start:681 stop:989 length:309 start_codon:yes stop_codon:yes gene_type:complete
MVEVGVYENPWLYRVNLSLLMILATSSVLSTGLLISRQANNTLDANTFGKSVNLEVVREGLRLRVTGKNTTEALKNLKEIESYLGTRYSSERSLPPNPQQVR